MNRAAPPRRAPFLRVEFFATAALVLNVCFCALQVFHAAFDHDEFQHAHIAWNLFRDKALYRDFFEHHGPLYSLINAFLWRTFELKPAFETLFYFRMTSLLYAVALLFLTFLLARAIFHSHRLALLATAILSGLYFFQDKATEIRPDGLQNLFWLIGLCLVFSRNESHRPAKMFGAGLAFGLALFTNTKSIFGIVVLFAVYLFFRLHENPPQKSQLANDLFALLAGMTTIFLLATLYFWRSGALKHFFYLNYSVNAWLMRHAGFWTFPDDAGFFLTQQTGVVAIALMALILAFRERRRLTQDQKIFLCLATGVSCGILFGLYRQFTLLFLPLLAIALAWALEVSSARQKASGAFLIAALLVNLEATALAHAPWKREPRQVEQRELTNVIVSQTSREEPIGYFWNECGGYMFNEDVQYFWMLEETLLPLFDRLQGTEVFGSTYVKVLKARKVRYIVGWSVTPHEQLPATTSAYIRENYSHPRPCLWERKEVR